MSENDKPRRELTAEEKQARSERARENGRKGGRPPKTAWNAEQRLREQARAKGESLLVACIDYWCELLAGTHEDATHDHRLRAAENIANRCGLPIRTETDVAPALAGKMVDLRGWFMPGGVLVPMTPDGDQAKSEQAETTLGAEPGEDTAAE